MAALFLTLGRPVDRAAAVRWSHIAMVGNALARAARAPLLRAAMWRGTYAVLATGLRRLPLGFLNYGYAPLDPEGTGPPLTEDEKDERYGAWLYAVVTGAVELAGRDVLEVSCGRGGGCKWILRHCGPRSVTGIDACRGAVRAARRLYGREGIDFRIGNAEALPFPNCTFDAVVNIESSHCYPSLPRFLAEAHRVLGPGGYLMIADFRDRSDVPAFLQALRESRMTQLEQRDISANVHIALERDAERRRLLIRRTFPRFLHPSCAEFAGLPGSAVHRGLADGEVRYLVLLLQREAA